LLNVVEEYLPAGAQMWEKVVSEYNAGRPSEFPERDLDSLRNKFKTLKNHKKPTGKITK
jgi:hypothetical protein